MNTLKNKVQLIGNLGANPEIISMENGKKLARLNLATNESYKNAQGEWITNTQWHNLVAWGKLAEYIENTLKKGSEIAVEGKLQNRSYTNKDGQKKYIIEIQLNELLLLKNRENKA